MATTKEVKEVKEEKVEKVEKVIEEVKVPERTLDDQYNEMVDFYEPIIDRNHMDDIIIGVNGKLWQIKRGEHVKVPMNVKMIWEQSKEQDIARYKMIDDFERNRTSVIAQL